MFRTKSQKKNMCTNCPIAKTADLVGDTVVLIILRELIPGSKRFGDIHAALQGASTRTLTDKLKKLEQQEIITRIEYKEKPPRVEYQLTQKGKGLKKIVQALLVYGEKYL
jgi:DNA-binding HxlR family transcriptional regulator